FSYNPNSPAADAARDTGADIVQFAYEVATNPPASLNVSFTKVTTGDLITDGGSSHSVAWGDYDNDGFVDLFVTHPFGPNFLYHNNGEGTFTRVTTGSIGNDDSTAGNAAWGDYDNDGYPDLFVARGAGLKNLLYHNHGDGTFTKISAGAIVNEAAYSDNCA